MKIKYLLFFSTILMSCQSQNPETLAVLLINFEKELPQTFPDYAAAMGMPQANDILVIPTKNRLEKNLDFCQRYLTKFQALTAPVEQPELAEQRIEKIEILEGMIKRMSGPSGPQNNPGFYNVYPALAWRISEIRQNPDDEEKMDLLLKTLSKVPDYFSEARKNLRAPTVKASTTTIDNQRRTVDFLENTVSDTIRLLPERDHRQKLEKALNDALIAVQDYAVFCESIE